MEWACGRWVVNVLRGKVLIKIQDFVRERKLNSPVRQGWERELAAAYWAGSGEFQLMRELSYLTRLGIFTEQIQFLESGFLTFLVPFLPTADDMSPFKEPAPFRACLSLVLPFMRKAFPAAGASRLLLGPSPVVGIQLSLFLALTMDSVASA